MYNTPFIVSPDVPIGDRDRLIPLDVWNQYCRRMAHRDKDDNRIGVACPSCECELSHLGGFALLCKPRKSTATCTDCGWKGLLLLDD